MSYLVRMPHLGANDEAARLVHWSRAEGELVTASQLIAEVETTKTVIEIACQGGGYLRPIAALDVLIPTGAPLAAITETPNEDYSALLIEARPGPERGGVDERKWTKKAEILARREGIDIAELAAAHPGKLLGEAEVEAFKAAKRTTSQSSGRQPQGVQRVMILGGAGGGGAALILDALSRCPDQRAVGVLDRDNSLHGQHILGVPVMGSTENVAAFWEDGLFDAAVIAFNRDLNGREEMFERLTSRSIPLCNVIDPDARIGLNASIGTGNVILAFCRIGPFAQVGDNNFLSAYVSIEHHCRLGSHCAFGPAVAFSGFVCTGDRVRFGTQIGIEPRLTIGSDTVIASGITLTRDVPGNSIIKSRATSEVRSKEQGAN